MGRTQARTSLRVAAHDGVDRSGQLATLIP